MARLQTKVKKVTLKVRTGDTVKILRGKDKGKVGKVLAALTTQRRILVEGINMVYKHIRPRRAGEKGQRVSVAAPVPVSNTQLVCPSCKRSTRVGIDRSGGMRKRVCKRCKATLD